MSINQLRALGEYVNQLSTKERRDLKEELSKRKTNSTELLFVELLENYRNSAEQVIEKKIKKLGYDGFSDKSFIKLKSRLKEKLVSRLISERSLGFFKNSESEYYYYCQVRKALLTIEVLIKRDMNYNALDLLQKTKKTSIKFGFIQESSELDSLETLIKINLCNRESLIDEKQLEKKFFIQPFQIYFKLQNLLQKFPSEYQKVLKQLLIKAEIRSNYILINKEMQEDDLSVFIDLVSLNNSGHYFDVLDKLKLILNDYNKLNCNQDLLLCFLNLAFISSIRTNEYNLLNDFLKKYIIISDLTEISDEIKIILIQSHLKQNNSFLTNDYFFDLIESLKFKENISQMSYYKGIYAFRNKEYKKCLKIFSELKSFSFSEVVYYEVSVYEILSFLMLEKMDLYESFVRKFEKQIRYRNQDIMSRRYYYFYRIFVSLLSKDQMISAAKLDSFIWEIQSFDTDHMVLFNTFSIFDLKSSIAEFTSELDLEKVA